jgi:hypothetical protein
MTTGRVARIGDVIRESLFDVRPPPRASRTAAHKLRLHGREPRLGQRADHEISRRPRGLCRDPDPVARPGAVRRLVAAEGDRACRRHARPRADPRARSGDVLHHVPARPRRPQGPCPTVRDDAVHAARRRRSQTRVRAPHPSRAVPRLGRRRFLLGGGRVSRSVCSTRSRVARHRNPGRRTDATIRRQSAATPR